MHRSIAAFASLGLLLLPTLASAHETQHFRIGEKEYMFVVGTLNEPVAIDDKAGVDLTVSLEPADEHDEGEQDESVEHTHEAGIPITGLEQTLQVELIAGDKKKQLPLTNQYGKPGSYKAVFIPTVQTTYSYRIFGTLEGAPLDVTFSCNPAGHPQTTEDNSEVPVSSGVTRTHKSGAFGCPVAKADLGFPEPSATIQELKDDGGTRGLAIAGLALGILGFVTGAAALRKRG